MRKLTDSISLNEFYIAYITLELKILVLTDFSDIGMKKLMKQYQNSCEKSFTLI